MLAHENQPVSQTGEDQSSPAACTAVLAYSVNQPEPEAATLNELVIENNWLRVGDAVYITETRRHTLTDADLNAAARAVIGGAA
jgi:hypothetical protein